MPFDAARAHSLYRALFGEAADLIKGKHLLVVLSGPLTQLPLQVLVESLPTDSPSGEQAREVALLGAELRDLSEEARQKAKLPGNVGVVIVKPVAGGPAERAGLQADDILLSIGGRNALRTRQAIDVIRTQTPHSTVRVAVWREETRIELDVALGATTIRQWQPLFLEARSMRKAAWLIRSHAITVLPAASSLRALRQYAKTSQATKPFLGVGNPLLEGPDQLYAGLREAARQRKRCGTLAPVVVAAAPGRGGAALVVQRGGIADVVDLRRAPPLPETADELCAVARVLGASESDVLLGARASEREIVRLSETGRLRNYRIVHFATHGALAGEASGSTEPGLLLTPPLTGSETDDGYLSASEIAGLKLDADWVILSACNTAAGEAKGAEALSGLARAFFYAGARALLVSHWYVDSNATVALIKEAFAELKSDPKIGRAEALRRSMLALIDRGAERQAHPAAWAPFVVVGEGSAGK
jgi:CHAT domain-containing protein